MVYVMMVYTYKCANLAQIAETIVCSINHEIGLDIYINECMYTYSCSYLKE
jgi:hypothetical protein